MRTSYTGYDIESREEALSGQGVRDHKFMVDFDGTLIVWDEAAGHYTEHHILTEDAERRIRKLADTKGLECQTTHRIETEEKIEWLKQDLAGTEATIVRLRLQLTEADEACETCGGLGTVDETLGGHSRANPYTPCPDCAYL